ncbi:MAG: bifunctional glutamate N-acetyltransferase/amino-acid acetyltransferase ArgJ [Acidobacteriia bacterium]|nr:bifunctional glutamate N-acetyltransferase/amino-acid acetyltransferase ArgJ [Terriglobia bacterium]
MTESNIPAGFLFSATTAGIKPSGKPDVALALAPEGAAAAAMFTRNQVVAAPVTVGRENLKLSKGKVRAVIVNAGNANCATGAPGLQAAKTVCQEVAAQIGSTPAQVFPSSTGIIGVPLPFEKITAAIPRLLVQAERNALMAFATAIMTTDMKSKVASEQINYKGRQVRLAGVAKGAGMIHPNMATMLVYLFTDVEASPKELHSCLKRAVDQSFNNISIDGDTSTNDTALLLASGQSRISFKTIRKPFEDALENVCRSLAAQIVADGEGAGHVVRLKIEQARNTDDARRIARAIANSPLVKTSWAGADPNWGRLLAAIGYSGVKINPAKINIYLGKQQICRNGMACTFDHAQAHQYMMQKEYEIRFTLGAGKASLEFLSCDLTAEYVQINADYST